VQDGSDAHVTWAGGPHIPLCPRCACICLCLWAYEHVCVCLDVLGCARLSVCVWGERGGATTHVSRYIEGISQTLRMHENCYHYPSALTPQYILPHSLPFLLFPSIHSSLCPQVGMVNEQVRLDNVSSISNSLDTLPALLIYKPHAY